MYWCSSSASSVAEARSWPDGFPTDAALAHLSSTGADVVISTSRYQGLDPDPTGATMQHPHADTGHVRLDVVLVRRQQREVDRPPRHLCPPTIHGPPTEHLH